MRVFENNVLGVLISSLLFISVSLSQSTYSEFLLNFLVVMTFSMLLMWTFLEYFFHRFLLHKETYLDDDKEADPKVLMEIFSKHVQHHVFMNQRYRIVQPIGTYFLILLLGLVATFFVHVRISCIFVAGLLVASLIYDWMHLAFHFDDVMVTK